MKHRKLAALVASVGLALAVPASAAAVGGPNEAGNSGHFHPKHMPCAAAPDHPHCPGPH
jgi:hypothetical protein